MADTINLTGNAIVSQESFGSPAIAHYSRFVQVWNSDNTDLGFGIIPPASDFGQNAVFVNSLGIISPPSIVAASVGRPSVLLQLIAVVSIPPQAAFGTTRVFLGRQLIADAANSGETFGNAGSVTTGTDPDRTGELVGTAAGAAGLFSASMRYGQSISPMHVSLGGATGNWLCSSTKDSTVRLVASGGGASGLFVGQMRSFQFSPFAGQRISVDQPQGGSNYPFRYGEVDDELTRLVADFYFMHPSSCVPLLPIKLVYLYGFGDPMDPATPPVGFPAGVHRYDVIVADSSGAVLFDTTAATIFSQSNWGDRLTVVEWKLDDKIARMVATSAYHDPAEIVSRPKYIIPSQANLHTRVLEPALPRVTQIQIGTTLTSAPSLRFRAGHNVLLGVTAVTVGDGARFMDSLTIHGDVGAGDGLQPADCQTTRLPAYSINGIKPTASGAISLNGDGCYRVDQAILGTDTSNNLIPVPNSLQIQQLCVPCCSCEQFVDLYRATGNEWTRLKAAGFSLETTRNFYKDGVDRYNAAIACHKANPITLQLEAFCSCRFGVAVAFCGWEEACVKLLELRTTFTVVNGSTDILNAPYVDATTVYANSGTNSVMRQAVTSTVYPQLHYAWSQLLPYVPAVVRCIIHAPQCLSGSSLTAVTEAYVDGVLIATSQERSVNSIRLHPDGKCR